MDAGFLKSNGFLTGFPYRFIEWNFFQLRPMAGFPKGFFDRVSANLEVEFAPTETPRSSITG